MEYFNALSFFSLKSLRYSRAWHRRLPKDRTNQSQLKSGLSQLSEFQKSNSCGHDVLSANSALKLQLNQKIHNHLEILEGIQNWNSPVCLELELNSQCCCWAWEAPPVQARGSFTAHLSQGLPSALPAPRASPGVIYPWPRAQEAPPALTLQ